LAVFCQLFQREVRRMAGRSLQIQYLLRRFISFRNPDIQEIRPAFKSITVL